MEVGVGGWRMTNGMARSFEEPDNFAGIYHG